MNSNSDRDTRNFLATGIRAATIVVVVGTFAAVWRPMHSNETSAAPAGAPVMVAAPDMSVYFPGRFPAPQGSVEELPAQF